MVSRTVDVSVSRIVLFNTLRIKHQQVFIDGNTHIAGLNNIGKTSFLRTLAYLFCGGRREALGLDDRMKSFNDFYFEHRDVNTPKLSMIVYEFKVVESFGDERTERFFTVTAYCPSKPRFLFVDCAYDPSNYIDLSEHQQWKTFSIIEDRLLEAVGRDVMRYHRTDSVEEFMSILFGCPSMKSFKAARHATNPNMLRKFCYFVPRYSTDFDPSVAKVVISKVLTRIICPPNTKKDSLNDLMEHLLFDQDSGRINLQEVRDDIAKYMVVYAAFRRWREPDSRSAQKSVLVNYPQYVEVRNSGRTILSRLRFAYNSARNRLSQIEVQMSTVQGELKALESEIERENEAFETRKNELGKRIAVMKDRMEKLEEKKAMYDPYLARKDEFEGIPDLESRKGALDARLTLLKAGKDEIHRVFDEARKGLEKIYNDYLLGEYGARRQALGTAVAERRDQLKTKLYEVDYAAVDAKYAEIRTRNANEIAQLNSRIEDCTRKIARIGEYRPLADDISAQRSAVKAIGSDLENVKKEVHSLTKDIEKENRVLEALPSQKEALYGYRIADLDSKVAAAAAGLEAVVRSIEDFGESLAGWLTENAPGWESTLGKALREDLLAAKGLSPELSGDGDALYGVRLDLDGFNVSVNTLANLEDRRRDAEGRLAEAKAAYGAVVAEADRWLASKVDEARAELARLEKERKDAGERKAVLENDLNVANTELARLNSEQERLQGEKLKELKEQLESSKKRCEVMEQASRSIEDEIKGEKDVYKKAFEDAIEAYAGEVDRNLRELEDARKMKEKVRDEGIAAAAQERDRRLRSEGIDTEAIESLQKESDSLLKRIDALKEEMRDWYSPAVRFMADDYVTYPETKEQCRALSDELRTATADHVAFSKKKGVELDACRTRRDALVTEDGKLSSDVETVGKRFFLSASEGSAELDTGRRKAFEAAIPMETSEKCGELLDELSSNEYLVGERRDKLNQAVKKLYNMFNGNYEQREVLFGQGQDYGDESVDDMERFTAMYDYISNGFADTILGSRQNEARILLNQLNSCTRSWKDYISEVDRQVVDINAELRNINFIQNIHRIEIRRRDRSDSLLANLEMISSLADEALDQYDFFALKGNRFYNIMQDLDETLRGRSEPVLKAIDSIRLEMRMDEGKNVGEWFDTFAVAGSNGTRFFAKNFFYVALLKSLVRKFARDGWRTHFPLLFDEVGTLSNNYMEQFLMKAKEAGFNCITAQPSVSWNVDLSLYDQEYKMTASEKYPNHVVIIDIFRKRNTFRQPGQE